MAPLGLGDVGSRLNQPRHLQLRATEQSSIAPSSPSTFSSLSLFFAYPPPFSLASFTSLSLCLSSSISPRQRSISDAYYQRYSSPNPFSTDSRSLFSLSLSLSRLCLYLPVNVFASSREDSFFRRYARFLPPVNPSRFDTSIGLWGNVATWFVVVTAIVGDRAVPSCRHFCFLEYL